MEAVDKRLSDLNVIATLRESAPFKALATALLEMAGLSITLIPASQWPPSKNPAGCSNPLCAELIKNGKECKACRAFCCTEPSPQSIKCAGNLQQTALPIRGPEKNIAFISFGPCFVDNEILSATDFPNFSKEARSKLKMMPCLSTELLVAATEIASLVSKELSRLVLQGELGQRHLHRGIEKAMDHIKKHFKDSLSLAEVAKIAGMSREHFCRTFKKVCGIGFSEYVNKIRVKEATAQLVVPNLQVTEIAGGVGFKSLTHFNRTFKRITGKSPTSYRQGAEAPRGLPHQQR